MVDEGPRVHNPISSSLCRFAIASINHYLETHTQSVTQVMILFDRSTVNFQKQMSESSNRDCCGCDRACDSDVEI